MGQCMERACMDFCMLYMCGCVDCSGLASKLEKSGRELGANRVVKACGFRGFEGTSNEGRSPELALALGQHEIGVRGRLGSFHARPTCAQLPTI